MELNLINWDRYLEIKTAEAMEIKLLAMIDQYAVSLDIKEMALLADKIDLAVRVLARCNRHYSTLKRNRYVNLKCEEITLVGYCLTVKPTEPTDFFKPPFLYKIYHERNGRNVLTSTYV